MRLSHRLVSSLIVAACALSPAAARAADTTDGPDPTAASLRASYGPYQLSRSTYSDGATPGFGSASIYAPKGTTKQFGVVAFAPGFTESTNVVSWVAQKVASYGFVSIVFNVNNTFTDFPYSRAQQLLAALDFATTTSNERSLIDPARQAVVGHSMGGGATLDASRLRPALKAAVGLAPWNPGISYSDVTVPSLEIGAQNDIIAPVANNARKFYYSLPSTTPRAFLNLKGADHFATNSPSARVGAATVAWLKRFVDDDTRYTPFICDAHLAINASELAGFSSGSC